MYANLKVLNMKKLFILPLLLISCLSFAQDAKEIIGKPIKIGKLLVAQYDIAYLNWADAKNACAKLGPGWRLPTKNELNTMYLNKDTIGSFSYIGYGTGFYYWSSTLSGPKNVWIQDFANGSQADFDSYWSSNKVVKWYGRAVKSL